MNSMKPLFLAAVLCAQLVYGFYSQGHQGGGYGGGYGHGVYSYDDHDHLYYHGPTAIPHVLPDGHIADTHEVAAAKAEHYTAVAKAKAYAGYGGSYGYGGNYGHGYAGGYGYGGAQGYGESHGYAGSFSGSHHSTSYHGPLAKPLVLKSGYLAETHEVAAAKAAHFTAVAKAKTQAGYGGDYGYRGSDGHDGSYGYGGARGYGGSYGHGAGYHTAPYHGPLARPVVLKSGYLADTHEVAAAKDRHLYALHSAQYISYHGAHY